MKNLLYILFLTCLCYSNLQAQYNTEKFYLERAEKLIEEGDYNGALDRLYDGVAKNPNSVDILYQIANCNYRLKDYDKAIEYAERVIRRDYKRLEAYRLVGNSYDIKGDYNKAVEYLNSKTKLFPYEGELYFDLGVIEYLRSNYQKAAYYWEKGIEAEPYFADNYYWASKVYAKSNEKVYALIYAETFLNIEKHTERTEEIALLLRDTYVNYFKEKLEGFSIDQIYMNRAGETNRFYDAFERVVQKMQEQQILRPYYINGKVMQSGKLSYSKQIADFRKEFVFLWAQMYPNLKMPLFKWQERMRIAGYIKPYSKWLLMSAEAEYFVEWQMKSYSSYDNFLQWYNRNPLKINVINRFCRLDYVEKLPTTVIEPKPIEGVKIDTLKIAPKLEGN